MKKSNIVAIFFTLIVVIISLTQVAFSAEDIKIEIDGRPIQSDVAPVILQGRTLVPARAIFEASGGEVTWTPDRPSDIWIKYKEEIVYLQVGSPVAKVNGLEKAMDVPASLINNRTLIPVRFVAESLNFQVDWNDRTRTVVIKSPETTSTVTPPAVVEPPLTPPVATNPAIGVPEEMNGQVQSVTFAQNGNGHRVTIKTDRPINDYVKMVLYDPNRFYIDLPLYELRAQPAEYLTEDINAIVKQIRSSQFDETTSRVVMDLREASVPTISFSADKKQMYLDFPRLKFDPYEDGRLVVMLDPGHGAETGGKRSFDGSFREYEFNRDIARRLKILLQNQGIEVLITAEDDKDLSLNDRCVKANRSDADIFVSLHANAFGTDWNKVNGWETYIYKNGGVSEQIGKEIQKVSIPMLGLANRGVKPSDFFVVKYTDMPAVLIEHGFYTNLEEVEKLKLDEFRQKCAEADAQGIINFFNLYKK